jgi:hypothetical protein
MTNPYPEFITDEVSGCEVPNERYKIWEQGFNVGQEQKAKEIGEWLPTQIKPILSNLIAKYPEANTATIMVYFMDSISESLKSGKSVGSK